MKATHKITIVLNWEALEKDIKDKAFKAAKSARMSMRDDAAADRAENTISLKGDDELMIRRAMTQSLSELVTLCGKYMWERGHASDNNLMSRGDIDITLMMPLNFNLSGCRSLGCAMHSYITSKTLAEYFRYAMPGKADEHQKMSEIALVEVSKILGARIKVDKGVSGAHYIIQS